MLNYFAAMRPLTPFDIRSQVSPKGTNSSRENSNSMTANYSISAKAEFDYKVNAKILYTFILA
jgi:hypothetical protein